MKKILLSIVAITVFGLANAQETLDGNGSGFSKGDFFVSGSVGFSNTKQGDAKANNFNFSPMMGYFVSENIALGAELSLGTSKQGDNKSNSLGVAAIGRYYFTPKNKFSIFGQGRIGYLSTKDEVADGGEAKNNGFSIGVGAGMSYFVSNHFAIEAGLGILGYQSTKDDVEGAEANNTLQLGIDMTSINIGVVYKF